MALSYDNCEQVLDDPILEIDENSTDEEKVYHAKHMDDSNKVSCIMIASMSLDL